MANLMCFIALCSLLVLSVYFRSLHRMYFQSLLIIHYVPLVTAYLYKINQCFSRSVVHLLEDVGPDNARHRDHDAFYT